MRFFRFLFFSFIYYGIHNFYILKYFGYLTSMMPLEFDGCGVIIYLVYTTLILGRNTNNKREGFFFYILELIFFAPMITYISFSNRFNYWFLIIFSIALLLYMLKIGSLTRKISFQVPFIVLDIFAIVSLFIALVFISKFRLNLNPERIYEIRDMAASNVTGIFRYILFWSASFSAPYLLMRSLSWGYSLLIASIVFILAEIFLFSVGNNKSFLFIACIALAYVWFENRSDNVNRVLDPVIIPKWLIKIFAICILILLFFPGSYVFMSIVFFRTFSVAPRQLDLYYSFMSEFGAEPTYLSQSFPISVFLDYPHSSPLGIEVSNRVLGLDNNSNAAFLFSDGIASFGIYLGPIVAFILFNFFISLLFQDFQRNRSLRTVLLLILMLQILNASILTSMITGAGFFIFLLSNVDKGVQADFIGSK